MLRMFNSRLLPGVNPIQNQNVPGRVINYSRVLVSYKYIVTRFGDYAQERGSEWRLRQSERLGSR